MKSNTSVGLILALLIPLVLAGGAVMAGPPVPGDSKLLPSPQVDAAPAPPVSPIRDNAQATSPAPRDSDPLILGMDQTTVAIIGSVVLLVILLAMVAVAQDDEISSVEQDRIDPFHRGPPASTHP